jgi:Polyketide cyclase / dehydrase and lipid transport
VDRREIEHSCEIVIDGPPDHVFALLSDLERYLARWANGPTAVRKLTGGPTGVGTRFEVTAWVAGMRVRSPYDLTGFERGRRFAGQGVAGPVRFSEEYTLAPDRATGDRTRLR